MESWISSHAKLRRTQRSAEPTGGRNVEATERSSTKQRDKPTRGHGVPLTANCSQRLALEWWQLLQAYAEWPNETKISYGHWDKDKTAVKGK